MALSAARKKIPNRGPIALTWGYFLDTGKTFYANALVALFGGYLRPCTGAPGEKVVGVAELVVDESVVSAGSAGATTPVTKIAVKTGIFGFAIGGTSDAVTQADVGRKVYAIDDTTIGKLSTGGRPVAGMLMEVEGTTAWVNVTGNEDAVAADGDGTAWQGAGSVEAISSAGALSVATEISTLAVTGTTAYTLANGLFKGQRKVATVVSGASTPLGTITPATPSGFATVTALGGVNDSVEFIWSGAAWYIASSFGCTFT